jgi:hypothetical protein
MLENRASEKAALCYHEQKKKHNSLIPRRGRGGKAGCPVTFGLRNPANIGMVNEHSAFGDQPDLVFAKS